MKFLSKQTTKLMKNRSAKVLILLLSFSIVLQGQEDLLALLEEDETTQYITATFKTSRVINSHSIENTPRGILDIKISHRFGFLSGGFYELFGLDGATIRLGGDLGLTDNLTIGLGRSSLEKTYDTYVKYNFLRQSTGKRVVPVGMTYVGTAAIHTLKFEDPNASNLFQSRLFYSHQLLIARKFNENLSIQIMPTLVHRNLVQTNSEKHDVISLGIGGRYKLSKRTSLNFEYFYNLPDQLSSQYKNSLSLGFDIETGGHVFQLHFTNSTSMIYKGFITETTGDWLEGGIHFGFNISRVFTLGKSDF